MSLKSMLAVPLITFPLIACAGSIQSFSDDYPSIWFRLFGMDVEMGPVTTSESYDAKSNHNGSAVLGPCSFLARPNEFRLGSGGWYGTIQAPGGRASGSLDCTMSVELNLSPAAGETRPAFLWPTFFVATHVDFEPEIETADYRWNLSALLTWPDAGTQREYRESQSHHCGADDPESQLYACRESFDDTGGLIGTRLGPMRLDLAIRLDFDLRAVPEPSPLSLLAFALMPFALVARRF